MKSRYMSYLKVLIISVFIAYDAFAFAQDTDSAIWDIQINLLDGTHLIFQVDNNLSVKVEDNTFILSTKSAAEPDQPSESAGTDPDIDPECDPSTDPEPGPDPDPDSDSEPSSDPDAYTLMLSDVKSYTYVKRVLTVIDGAVRSCPVFSLEGNVLILNESEHGENQMKIFDVNGVLLRELNCTGSARLPLDTFGKGLRIISINGKQSLKCLIE